MAEVYETSDLHRSSFAVLAYLRDITQALGERKGAKMLTLLAENRDEISSAALKEMVALLEGDKQLLERLGDLLQLEMELVTRRNSTQMVILCSDDGAVNQLWRSEEPGRKRTNPNVNNDERPPKRQPIKQESTDDEGGEEPQEELIRDSGDAAVGEQPAKDGGSDALKEDERDGPIKDAATEEPPDDQIGDDSDAADEHQIDEPIRRDSDDALDEGHVASDHDFHIAGDCDATYAGGAIEEEGQQDDQVVQNRDIGAAPALTTKEQQQYAPARACRAAVEREQEDQIGQDQDFAAAEQEAPDGGLGVENQQNEEEEAAQQESQYESFEEEMQHVVDTAVNSWLGEESDGARRLFLVSQNNPVQETSSTNILSMKQRKRVLCAGTVIIALQRDAPKIFTKLRNNNVRHFDGDVYAIGVSIGYRKYNRNKDNHHLLSPKIVGTFRSRTVIYFCRVGRLQDLSVNGRSKLCQACQEEGRHAVDVPIDFSELWHEASISLSHEPTGHV